MCESPNNYQNISSCVTPSGVSLQAGESHSCSCDPGECGRSPNTCSCLKGYPPAYDDDGVLLPFKLSPEAPPIYECNSWCACGADCKTRGTQRGDHPALQVYQTDKKGYGVRTTRDLLKGEFVCEYVGELIPLSNAKNKLSTLPPADPCFVLIYKEHFGTVKTLCTCIDATVKGNTARFINHSCDPNLVMLPVRSDSIVPRLCLFTLRAVTMGTELCFSYGDTLAGSGKPCYCGSETCKGYLPYEPDM
ncbi:histone-lysine N-methyltransferase SETMAR-like [Dysidea avara]|uniref:histone-lysine N-methyltransferase SETMAR-like n=1 Tax=Dysidea avara TaxID=196820 RepID=UPI00332B73B1